MIVKALILTLFFSFEVWPHGGIDHSKKSDDLKNESLPKIGARANSNFSQINKKYLSNVKPIFKKSCFDCHSNKTIYPWYYKVPVIKDMIDLDIKEAKSHLDFSGDFPFESHDSPKNDLISIGKTVVTGSMPPMGYRLLHPDSKLSREEITKISDWVRTSLLLLENK